MAVATRAAGRRSGDGAGFGRRTATEGCCPRHATVLAGDRTPTGSLLATGHLARDEIFSVVDAALDEGVREIVITHPDFPSQSLSVDDQRALAERRGRCSNAASRRRTPARRPGSAFLRRPIRATGAEHSVLVDRPRADGEPARRGRPRPHGRPVARGRVRRGGGACHGGAKYTARRGCGDVSRRLLVIGAHSADFVWRAAGAVAVTTSRGRGSARHRALIRGAGRVR